MKCFCGAQHFVIHKNALSLTSKKQYYHLFHKDLKIGYSIHECVSCQKLYICIDNLKNTVDRFIPVELIKDYEIMSLIARVEILLEVQHYTKEFVSNMKVKK